VIDSLAVMSDDGESYTMSNAVGGRRFGGDGGGRPTGRGTLNDPDVVQGRPALDPRFELPPRQSVEQWQLPPITDDQLRNPIGVIPPDQRPRAILRFSTQRDLLVSGTLSGGANVADHPVVVDVPKDQGHVVLFSINPIYRGETVGSYFLVLNTILNFDNLNAGRKLDGK